MSKGGGAGGDGQIMSTGTSCAGTSSDALSALHRQPPWHDLHNLTQEKSLDHRPCVWQHTWAPLQASISGIIHAFDWCQAIHTITLAVNSLRGENHGRSGRDGSVSWEAGITDSSNRHTTMKLIRVFLESEFEFTLFCDMSAHLHPKFCLLPPCPH